MQATQSGPCPEPASVRRRGLDKRSVGRLEVEHAVWPRCVVVRRVLHQNEPEVPLVDDDRVVPDTRVAASRRGARRSRSPQSQDSPSLLSIKQGWTRHGMKPMLLIAATTVSKPGGDVVVLRKDEHLNLLGQGQQELKEVVESNII